MTFNMKFGPPSEEVRYGVADIIKEIRTEDTVRIDPFSYEAVLIKRTVYQHVKGPLAGRTFTKEVEVSRVSAAQMKNDMGWLEEVRKIVPGIFSESSILAGLGLDQLKKLTTEDDEDGV